MAPAPSAFLPASRRAALAAVIAVGALLALAVRSTAPGPSLGAGGARVTVPTSGAMTSLAVIGDFGTADAAETAVASLVAGWSPAAVLSVGDDYYASAGGSGLDRYDRTVGGSYCAFLRGAYPGRECPTGGTADMNRFWSAAGNHEYTDGGIANYTGYFPPPGDQPYYSVTIGSVEVFVLDSDAALRTPSLMAAEQAWLRTAATASTAAWQVVLFHHPPYSSGLTHGSSTAMRWPFATWGIDLVVSGHEHDYERVAVEGITYVVDGLGGAGIYRFGRPIAGSQVRYNADHGALRLDATAIELGGTFMSVDGVIQDTFTVTQVLPGPVATP